MTFFKAPFKVMPHESHDIFFFVKSNSRSMACGAAASFEALRDVLISVPVDENGCAAPQDIVNALVKSNLMLRSGGGGGDGAVGGEIGAGGGTGGGECDISAGAEGWGLGGPGMPVESAQLIAKAVDDSKDISARITMATRRKAEEAAKAVTDAPKLVAG